MIEFIARLKDQCELYGRPDIVSITLPWKMYLRLLSDLSHMHLIKDEKLNSKDVVVYGIHVICGHEAMLVEWQT